MTRQISSRPSRTSCSVRHASSFSSISGRSTCRVSLQWASSSSPVRNGCATGVVSCDDPSSTRRRPRRRRSRRRPSSTCARRASAPSASSAVNVMPLGCSGSVLRRCSVEVLVLDEVDLVLAEQREALRRADLGEAPLDGTRVAQLGPLARRGRAGRPCRCRARARWRRASRTAATARRRPGRARRRRAAAPRTCAAARIGPTVCELDGPMPIEKRSKTLSAMVS